MHPSHSARVRGLRPFSLRCPPLDSNHPLAFLAGRLILAFPRRRPTPPSSSSICPRGRRRQEKSRKKSHLFLRAPAGAQTRTHPSTPTGRSLPTPQRPPNSPYSSPAPPPLDSNRLTAPCFLAPRAHLWRAMCAPITWQGARKSTTTIVRMGAALGAASGTFRLPPEFLPIYFFPLDSNLGGPNRDPNAPNPPSNPPDDDGRPTTPAPGVLRVLSRPEPSRKRVLRGRLVDTEVNVERRAQRHRPGSHGATRVGAIWVGLLLPPQVQVRRDAPRWRRRQRRQRRRRRRRQRRRHFFWHVNLSLLWRRATVGAGRGAPAAPVGGLVGGWRSPPPGRRVPMAGKGWVAPQEPETRPPSRGHVHARADARTVTFNYNCVTVRRPRVYIKLSLAISIV